MRPLVDIIREHRAIGPERTVPTIVRCFIDPATRQEVPPRIFRTQHQRRDETTIFIPTAPIFRPLLEPARYKGAYGGRGSGKSHFFAELMVEECIREPGTLAVCIRETQNTLRESAKRLIESSPPLLS